MKLILLFLLCLKGYGANSSFSDELDHVQKRTISNHLKDKGYFKINTIKEMNIFLTPITIVLTRRLPNYTKGTPEERSRCDEYHSMCLKLKLPFHLNAARFNAAFAALATRFNKPKYYNTQELLMLENMLFLSLEYHCDGLTEKADDFYELWKSGVLRMDSASVQQ
ncbi:MAG: hypothetical protein OXC30_00030 [Alphaproteobacteria bacterium]|nr:hypothetical protein [Alphaproteobacteria bacterium]